LVQPVSTESAVKSQLLGVTDIVFGLIDPVQRTRLDYTVDSVYKTQCVQMCREQSLSGFFAGHAITPIHNIGHSFSVVNGNGMLLSRHTLTE